MLKAVSLLKNCYLFRIFKKEVLDFSLLYMITWMYHQYYVAVWKHQGKDNAFVENHKKWQGDREIKEAKVNWRRSYWTEKKEKFVRKYYKRITWGSWQVCVSRIKWAKIGNITQGKLFSQVCKRKRSKIGRVYSLFNIAE